MRALCGSQEGRHYGADNLWMGRQEKLSHIEGESPSRLNMHDNAKT